MFQGVSGAPDSICWECGIVTSLDRAMKKGQTDGSEGHCFVIGGGGGGGGNW